MHALKTPAALLMAALLVGCGATDASDAEAVQPAASATAAAPAALTAIELEQGIGPIRDLQLGAIDEEMAEEGEESFVMKCSACHKIDSRYVAPMLGDVLSRRSPEFVMNMMLNAAEMVQRHPEVQKLLAEFFTPMPVQITEESEARAILEYLRSAQIETP